MTHASQHTGEQPPVEKWVGDLNTGRRMRKRRGQGEDGRTERGGQDGERRGAAEKNTREFSLNLSAEKSFLTVTQNQPREKKPCKMRPCNFSVSHREKHYKKAKSKYN